MKCNRDRVIEIQNLERIETLELKRFNSRNYFLMIVKYNTKFKKNIKKVQKT